MLPLLALLGSLGILAGGLALHLVGQLPHGLGSLLAVGRRLGQLPLVERPLRLPRGYGCLRGGVVLRGRVGLGVVGQPGRLPGDLLLFLAEAFHLLLLGGPDEFTPLPGELLGLLAEVLLLPGEALLTVLGELLLGRGLVLPGLLELTLRHLAGRLTHLPGGIGGRPGRLRRSLPALLAFPTLFAFPGLLACCRLGLVGFLVHLLGEFPVLPAQLGQFLPGGFLLRLGALGGFLLELFELLVQFFGGMGLLELVPGFALLTACFGELTGFGLLGGFDRLPGRFPQGPGPLSRRPGQALSGLSQQLFPELFVLAGQLGELLLGRILLAFVEFARLVLQLFQLVHQLGLIGFGELLFGVALLALRPIEMLLLGLLQGLADLLGGMAKSAGFG